MRRAIGVMVPVLLTALVFGGCGSDTEQRTGTGRLRLIINWPDPARAIPPATQSIKIEVRPLVPPASDPEETDPAQWVVDQEAGIVAEGVANRPQGQATTVIELDAVPSVIVRVTVVAYAGLGGGGDQLASGSSIADVPQGGVAPVSLTLDSGVAFIKVAAGGADVPAGTAVELPVGETLVLTATAHGADGTPVDVADDSWSWSVHQDASTGAPVNLSDTIGSSVTIEALQGGTADVVVTQGGEFELTLPIVVQGVYVLPSGFWEARATMSALVMTGTSAGQYGSQSLVVRFQGNGPGRMRAFFGRVYDLSITSLMEHADGTTSIQATGFDADDLPLDESIALTATVRTDGDLEVALTTTIVGPDTHPFVGSERYRMETQLFLHNTLAQ